MESMSFIGRNVFVNTLASFPTGRRIRRIVRAIPTTTSNTTFDDGRKAQPLSPALLFSFTHCQPHQPFPRHGQAKAFIGDYACSSNTSPRCFFTGYGHAAQADSKQTSSCTQPTPTSTSTAITGATAGEHSCLAGDTL